MLVIGGGIAGLLCAYELAKDGVDCILVEADRICRGVTRNTTAKLCSQHGLIYDKLRREFSLETAGAYLHANEVALEHYRRLCREVDCDFQEEDAFVYSLRDTAPLERELYTLGKLGFPAEFTDHLPLPFPVAGAVRFSKQGQFHPLKFLFALAKDLRIYENTRVTELLPGEAVTDRGRIRAKKIIVATHFPFLNKHGNYFLKLYQERSYVLALKNAPLPKGMYVDADARGLSFRTWGEYLLLGGGGHRTGKKGGGWQELRDFKERFYPQAQEVAHWATQDCMTLDGIPYIGQYSAKTPGLFVTTGFHKWGMTSAMVAALLLRDLVQGKENPWSGVFSPSRSILRPQLLCNAGESILHLLKPTAPRCPHLGCALRYNPQEHSWDCPCHGSRFTEDGQLLDNPATGDLEK